MFPKDGSENVFGRSAILLPKHNCRICCVFVCSCSAFHTVDYVFQFKVRRISRSFPETQTIPKTQTDKSSWDKFGTIGFVRLKCKKSRSFAVLEAHFHVEIFNLVPGGVIPPPVLTGLRKSVKTTMTQGSRN